MSQQQKDHIINGKQKCYAKVKRFQGIIKLPRQLYQSRTSVMKWMCQEKDQTIKGIRCFWLFLLTYMQVEHYDISFTRILQKIKTNQQTQINNDQQKSQDTLSNSSSVHIRQRKVSFGLIKPTIVTNDYQNDKKKRRKNNINMNNMFIIGNGDNIMDQQQQRRLKQRQIRLRQLLKKVKLLVYQYAQRVDVLQQSEYSNNSNNHKQLQKPLLSRSIIVAKALQTLFPKQQTKIKNIFQQQKYRVDLILQLLSDNKDLNINQQYNKEKSIKTNNINLLMNLLQSATKQKILNNNNNYNNQTTKDSNITIINRLSFLLEYFGFCQQKDFEIISTHDNNDYFSDSRQEKNVGIKIMNGFFNIVVGVDDGYLMTIDVDKLDGIINDKVKSMFRQCLLLSSKPQQKARLQLLSFTNNNKQQQQQQQQQPISSNIYNHISNHPLQPTTTPTQFITRYNNRYFKNQRLLYKQKTKLQNRFKQQHTDNYLFVNINCNDYDDRNNIYDNNHYDNGYQIVVNDNNRINRLNRDDNERRDGQQVILEGLDELKICDKIKNQQLLQLQLSRQNNKQPLHEDITDQHNNQLILYDEINNLLLQDELNNNFLQQNQSINKSQQLLSKLYSRQDFQISDNQILDDIERVLI